MNLPPFLLDEWLDHYKDAGIRHDLAASTGPAWSLRELLDLASEDERRAIGDDPLLYCAARGGRELRDEIAAHHGVAREDVLVTTGASEALHILFFDAAQPGANVVVSSPGFPPTWALPQGLGLEVRTYALRAEAGFRLDLEEVARLVDGQTRLLLVTSPHNPTGAVVEPPLLAALADLASSRGAVLVADEVYHPLYDGPGLKTAATLPGAIVVGDFSKALCLSGLRLGYIVDRDPERRERWLRARMHFTITSPALSEALGTVALRNRQTVLSQAGARVLRNRAAFAQTVERLSGLLAWVPPRGGTTAFPWLTFADDSRPFAEALAREGVLVAPGDCFGNTPEVARHFRVGLGASDGFAEALPVLEGVVRRIAESTAVARSR
jgi:aspartate/methionine/tyrosine aminotransferase